MNKKVFVLVIDGFGVGEMPDAKEYEDEGSNTFVNITKHFDLNIPNMTKLGLKDIDGVNLPHNNKVIGCYAKMLELSKGKDTTTGHFEMMDIIAKQKAPTFPNGFDDELVKKLIKELNIPGFIGNTVASGTEIINRLGEEHIKTRKPILYTSADSVLQIATHTSVYSLEELYEMCKKARKIMVNEYGVNRVIARPFAGNIGEFYRLGSDRKDFALKPNKNNSLERIMAAGFETIAVGKIYDIFAEEGFTQTYNNHTNKESLEVTLELLKKDFSGLAFVNLVDTDMLYGHRNDIEGYKNSLEQTDVYIGKILEQLGDNDILIVTGDHGCDPTTPSTNHSREYTPLLCYSKQFKNNVNLHTIEGFNCIGKLSEAYLTNTNYDLLNKVLKDGGKNG